MCIIIICKGKYHMYMYVINHNDEWWVSKCALTILRIFRIACSIFNACLKPDDI